MTPTIMGYLVSKLALGAATNEGAVYRRALVDRPSAAPAIILARANAWGGLSVVADRLNEDRWFTALRATGEFQG